MTWKPKFKVGQCIQWGNYENLCITEIVKTDDSGVYKFGNMTMWGPNVDDGVAGVPPGKLVKGVLHRVFDKVSRTIKRSTKKGGRKPRRIINNNSRRRKK